MDKDFVRTGTLLDTVIELISLNDENLAKRVIDNSDVQWCLSELYDILKEEKHCKYIADGWDEIYTGVGRCSICGGQVIYGSKYCPNCGAKIEVE